MSCLLLSRSRSLMLLAALALAILAAPLTTQVVAQGAAQEATAHVFWQEGCPHCSRAKEALSVIAEEGGLRLDLIELGVSDADDRLFAETLAHFNVERSAVPMVVVGGDYRIGFASGGFSEGEYRQMIARCRSGLCTDPVGDLRAAAAGQVPGEVPGEVPGVASPTPVQPGAPGGGTMTLPVFGEVSLDTLSLPLLTLVLAGVDGFNPCAMWVLALLIGLLLGVENTRRMWTLGAVFLIATGVMYFAVMAAWLNVILWIGAVSWIRLAIGALAIGAGVYYLREYWTNPEGVCKVTGAGRKRTFSQAFQAMVEQPSLIVAALGVAALAIAVNLVELACSAGLPAIYTQVLAMHDLPAASYYGYLAAYLAVFLLDDTILFVVAMITLRAAVTTGRYSRLSHLIGGVVLLALGVVMVLRPDLLG